MRAINTCRIFLPTIFMVVGCLITPLGLAAEPDAGEETPESVSYTLIKTTELDKTVTFDVLNPADLKTRTVTVTAEQRALDRAYNNLAAQWKAKFTPKSRVKTDKKNTDKKTVIPPYPLKRPEPKKIVCVSRFPTEAEALAKKKECEAKEADRLQEVKNRTEKTEADRQRRTDPPATFAGLSTPKAPMAKGVAADELDPDLQNDLFAQLQQEIDDIIAGGAGSAPKAQSKGGKTITVTQGKRMGEGASTPLTDHAREMAKPDKPDKPAK